MAVASSNRPMSKSAERIAGSGGTPNDLGQPMTAV
jgi:hypothetical protein